MDPAHLSFLHTIEETTGFPKELKVEAELDYMETPTGMIYISTRCPNIHQFTTAAQDFPREVRFKRPTTTQWSVPVDDTHTMNFRLRHVSEDEKGEIDLLGFGQAENRPYEERQRVPGDYDAQVNQRPIAIHALEHLASTDRGVIMVRKLIREGIRAVQSGQDPKGLVRSVSGAIPTYANDTIIRVSPAPGLEADREVVRQTGRRIAEECSKNHPG